MASVFDELEDADARPLGRWESGTRIGLCLLIARFFCDLPMVGLVPLFEAQARDTIDTVTVVRLEEVLQVTINQKRQEPNVGKTMTATKC